MDSTNLLSRNAIRRVLRDWVSLKALGENPLATLSIVLSQHQLAHYSDSAIGRGLALRNVVQAALESLKPDDNPPNIQEKRWRPYIILTEQYLNGRNPAWVMEQIHVSKGTYYSEQEKALGLLVEILQKSCAESTLGAYSKGGFQTYPGRQNTRPLKIYEIPFMVPSRPAYSLVGRDDMCQYLKECLLNSEDRAVIALEGLPGVGKTAIAIELAHDPEVREHFSAGILWAGLGRNPDLLALLGAWAAAIGISSEAIASRTSPVERATLIRAVIGLRPMLLIVDDAWQSEAALTFKLGGPYCAHLMTTRLAEVALDFAGGQTTRVQELSREEGVQLLAQVAPKACEAAPHETQALVQSVGGLPLALILMGRYLQKHSYRVQSRRLQEVLAELGKAEVRLRVSLPQTPLDGLHPDLPFGTPLSLQSVIELSDQALDKAVHQALLNLALLPSKPNTFSEEAGLALSDSSARTLDALVDCGLVEAVKPNRYSLHQTISDYASLYGSDSSAIDRLLGYFVRFTGAHAEDFEILELEFNNIQAALAIANQTNRYRSVIALVSALYSFLETRGLFVMCEQQLSKIHQIGEASGNQEEQAFILHWLGSFAIKRGRFKEALDYLEHSILLAQASKAQVLDEQRQPILYGRRAGFVDDIKTRDPDQPARPFTLYNVHPGLTSELETSSRQERFTLYGIYSTSLAYEARVHALEGHNLFDLGMTRIYMGYFIEGCAYVHSSLRIYREMKMRQEEGLALNALGYAYQELCDYQKSHEYLDQALFVCRESNDQRGEGWVHQNLSLLYLSMGDFRQALEHSEKCLEIYSKVGDMRGRGWQLYHLGRIQRQLGNYDRARAYFEQARQIMNELGDQMGLGFAIHNLGLIAADLGEDSVAQDQIEKALEIFQQIECAGTSQANYSLGVLHRRHGDYPGAMPYFERALQYRREHGYRRGIAMALANLGLVKYCLGESTVCLDYAYEALNLIEKIGARPNKARILTYLGNIQLGLGEFDQATESYQSALSLRRELGQINLALEPLAGLAQAFWLRGDLSQAYSYVEAILSYLEARRTCEPLEVVLAGLDDPIQVYLSCYHVLSAKEISAVEKAPTILQNDILDIAIQLLKRRSAQIEDEQQRALFIENVPGHREIREISRRRLERNL